MRHKFWERQIRSRSTLALYLLFLVGVVLIGPFAAMAQTDGVVHAKALPPAATWGRRHERSREPFKSNHGSLLHHSRRDPRVLSIRHTSDSRNKSIHHRLSDRMARRKRAERILDSLADNGNRRSGERMRRGASGSPRLSGHDQQRILALQRRPCMEDN